MVVGGPDPLVHELFGDPARELGAVREPDEVQHEVEGRGPARAGDPLAIDLEQVGGDLERRELLGEGLDVLPVDGAPVSVEQAGPCEQVRPGAEPADDPAPACDAPEPCRRVPIRLRMGIEPGADEERLAFARVGHRRVGRHPEPVARDDRAAVPGDDPPVIEASAAQAVGAVEGVYGRRERQHREPGDQKEGTGLRGHGANSPGQPTAIESSLSGISCQTNNSIRYVH